MSSEDRQAEVWKSFCGLLTARGQALLNNETRSPLLSIPDPVNDEDDAFVLFEADLRPETREKMASFATEEVEEVDVSGAKYCLIECRDGEWPTLNGYKTPQSMAKRISDLEGEDIVVFAVMGVPMPITKGPQRYVFLPDGKTAMAVPVHAGGPSRMVDASLLSNLSLEDEGFLGPPQLARDRIVKPQPAKARRGPIGDDDDDEATAPVD